MTRPYRMRKRADARDDTRERIVRATMALHDEQGVATTSFADIATRAGVGAATVYRHFPTQGSLVQACGAHVAADMRPPQPEDAPAIFAGLHTRAERMERLIAELDAFYARGALRLAAAWRDRDRVPELDAFLRWVGEGVEALVREALGGGDADEREVHLVVALMDFPVWGSLRRLNLREAEAARLKLALVSAALAAARTGQA